MHNPSLKSTDCIICSPWGEFAYLKTMATHLAESSSFYKDENTELSLSVEKLDVSRGFEAVRTDSAGAVSSFIGGFPSLSLTNIS